MLLMELIFHNAPQQQVKMKLHKLVSVRCTMETSGTFCITVTSGMSSLIRLFEAGN